MKSYKPWTGEELSFLRENASMYTCYVLAQHLDRSEAAIYKQAGNLKLSIAKKKQKFAHRMRRPKPIQMTLDEQDKAITLMNALDMIKFQSKQTGEKVKINLETIRNVFVLL